MKPDSARQEQGLSQAQRLSPRSWGPLSLEHVATEGAARLWQEVAGQTLRDPRAALPLPGLVLSIHGSCWQGWARACAPGPLVTRQGTFLGSEAQDSEGGTWVPLGRALLAQPLPRGGWSPGGEGPGLPAEAGDGGQRQHRVWQSHLPWEGAPREASARLCRFPVSLRFGAGASQLPPSRLSLRHLSGPPCPHLSHECCPAPARSGGKGDGNPHGQEDFLGVEPRGGTRTDA